MQRGPSRHTPRTASLAEPSSAHRFHPTNHKSTPPVADAGSTTVFYDPLSKLSDVWAPLVKQGDKLVELIGSMELEQLAIKMQPWDVLFMANPIPHEVTPIMCGDRLCFVGFVGFGV